MWESPVYRFNQPVDDDETDELRYRQIVIDVTGSAPSFDKPYKALRSTINAVLKGADVDKEHDAILDFGAGKLRNTLYLLRKGYRVRAVEFGSLFERSEQAQRNWGRARRFGDRFTELIYPKDFVGTSRTSYKLALLINVPTIMPVPAERLLVLQQCHDAVVSGGYLLWYSQRGDQAVRARMTDDARCGDGYFTGRTTKKKQFYREYKDEDIQALLLQTGFEFVDTLTQYATWRNQAHLYRRFGSRSPFAGVLTAEAIEKARVSDRDIPDPETATPEVISVPRVLIKGDPDPPKLRLDKLRAEALASIPDRPRDARAYEDQVLMTMARLFGDDLLNLGFADGSKRPRRIVGDNKRTGFFGALWDRYHIGAPYVLTQCINSRHSLKNENFAQLGAGLRPGSTRFGFAAYRGGRRDTMVRRCRRLYLWEGSAVVPVDDNDFGQYLAWKQASQTGAIDGALYDVLAPIVRPASVFISYAHEDRKFHGELRRYLDPVAKLGGIRVLDDTKLKEGQRWPDEIDAMMGQATTAIVLISEFSRNSDFIEGTELPMLLDAADAASVGLYLVIVRDTLLGPQLGPIQAANDPEDPIEGRRPAERRRFWKQLTTKVIDGMV